MKKCHLKFVILPLVLYCCPLSFNPIHNTQNAITLAKNDLKKFATY